jgi:hypothetical protein
MKNYVELTDGLNVYRLCFSANAMIVFEDGTGLKIKAIGEEFAKSKDGDMSMRFMRSLLHCLLTDHHEDLSEKDAGRLLTDCGFEASMLKISEAVNLAFPEAVKGGKAGKTKRAAKTAG